MSKGGFLICGVKRWSLWCQKVVLWCLKVVFKNASFPRKINVFCVFASP